MTTEEIVGKLVEYIKRGENVKAEEELYADSVVSFEQDGRSAHGKEAVIAKTKAAVEYIEEFHSVDVSKAWIGDNNFLLEITMDVTPKGGERVTMTELGFYKLTDGLVTEEYFFMQPAF